MTAIYVESIFMSATYFFVWLTLSLFITVHLSKNGMYVIRKIFWKLKTNFLLSTTLLISILNFCKWNQGIADFRIQWKRSNTFSLAQCQICKWTKIFWLYFEKKETFVFWYWRFMEYQLAFGNVLFFFVHFPHKYFYLVWLISEMGNGDFNFFKA